MTKNVPATRDYEVVAYEARDGQKITLTPEVVKNFLVTGKKELVSIQELIYFMGICKARGLNPFARDCYLIKYSDDPAAIITSIDFYRSRARAQEDCTGWECGVIVLRKDGTIHRSYGLILPDEELVGGWFKAQPKGWTTPFEIEVNLSGYIKKTAAGATTKFWAKENQPTMIRKVVESQGLRILWPDPFRGTVIAEEIGQLSELLGAVELMPEGEPEKPKDEEYDTSKFDAMVEEKLKHLPTGEEAAIRAAHLGVYLKQTAKKMSTKKEPWTPEKLMVSVVDFFEPYTLPAAEAKKRGIDPNQKGFWLKFLAWEAHGDRPWNQPPPPPDAGKEAPGGGEDSPWPDKKTTETAGGEGEPETFDQVAERVYGQAVSKYPKLKDMKEHLGITHKKDLTPENIAEIEAKLKEAE
jgi:phage recombination protein Bet